MSQPQEPNTASGPSPESLSGAPPLSPEAETPSAAAQEGGSAPAADQLASSAPSAERPSAEKSDLKDRVRSQLGARQAAQQDAASSGAQAGEREAARPARERTAAAQRVPVPPRRGPMADELERELAEALGDASLDQLLAQGALPTPPEAIEIDSRRRATVVRIHKDNVFFTLGGSFEGIASLRAFPEPPEIGATMDVLVTGYNSDDDLYEVAIPGASIDVGDWSDIRVGSLVECRVTGANTGGLECMVNQIRGFIPASQVGIYRVDNLSDYINQKLVCMVTEANPQRRNLVLSRRSVLEREREEARQALLEQIEPGQTREGVVRSIRDFGAFVDLGGVDGLIHISQLSWDRVNDPREVLEEGQRVQVRVEKVDRQTGKISLSYRNLQEHPWHSAPERFPVGSTVRGVVSRIAKFGAFVKLAPGVEGLIHISELSHQRVAQVSSVVQEGQEIEAKVVSMDAENQRIGLSLKALLAAPAAAAEVEEPEPEEEVAAPSRPKREMPLKGGLDRGSGGESFGLKW